MLFRATTFLFSLFLLASCGKKTITDFKLEKAAYAAGDQLEIDNRSSNSKKQKWTVTDASGDTIIQSEDKNPNLVLPILCADGAYKLDLIAFKRNEKKAKLLSKTFLVKTFRSQLNVEYNPPGSAVIEFTLFVDDQEIGKSTNGKRTVQIPMGIRLIKIVTVSYSPKALSKTIDVLYGGNTQSITFY